ncbi:MAG: DUF2271 domain-containing protein [Verrucomicrobia bacterium]|nr:DUF2271 domain-containing protein [Verrucomicrobiota bacterium]
MNTIRFMAIWSAVAALFVNTALAQTSGSVTFNARISDYTGKSDAKHYTVIWVTKTNGTTNQFIKTLWKQGPSNNWTSSEWGSHVGTWNTARAGSTSLDGYTSATATTYSSPNNPISVTWNCLDASSALVADGEYKFWIQYAENSGQGPVTTGLAWTKGATGGTTNFPAQGTSGSPVNGNNFTNMSAVWTPNAPEIGVEYPTATDLTDGTASVNFATPAQGSSTTLTFTIRNRGTAALTGLAITKDGTHATDFSVGTLASTLAAGTTTTFTVSFAPGGSGARTAAIHIASNDANENPFDINLTGTGIAAPEIAVEQPAGTNLVDGTASVNFGSVTLGGSTPLVFTLRNTGSTTLSGIAITKDGTNAADYTVGTVATSVVAGGSTTFTVTFAPAAAGTRTAAIHIASNDSNESPFDISLTGAGGVVPEIAVEYPTGTNLTDGSSSIACGSTAVGTTTTAITVTIRNPGTANLTGLAITKDGTHAGDFSIGTPLATTLAAGASTTFTIAFGPGAAGSRTAAIHIASNDADENPFDITLTGTGLTPEIAVEQPSGNGLTDNGAAVSCGTGEVGKAETPLVFNVRNLGTASLTGLTLSKDGAHAADFTLGSLGVTTLAAGGSTTFTVTFSPSAAGARTAAVHLGSNDADENPFDINLTGTGEVRVYTPGTADLTTTLVTLGGSEHWSVVWITKNDGTFIKTLHIRGNGFAGDNSAFWDSHWADHCGAWNTARGSNQTIDGFTGATAPSYAAPNNPLAVTWNGRDAGGNLMPDGTYKLWVQYSEDSESGSGPVTTAGIPIVKGSSAYHANPPNQTGEFSNISVNWVPIAPVIAVEQPAGAPLVHDTATVDFGSGPPGTPIPRTFTIRNTGNADLTGISVTRDGTHATDFAITTPPATTLAAGATTTFAVAFSPAATGTRTAALHIASNDANTNPFNVNLTGSGAVPLSPFESWIATSGLAPELRAPQLSPFGDGVTNLQKFAFNLDPSKADSRKLVAGAGGTAGLPSVTTGANGVIHIEFIRRKAATAPGVVYRVEVSSDLTNWFDLTHLAAAVSINETWERVTVDDIPPAGGGLRFARVRVEESSSSGGSAPAIRVDLPSGVALIDGSSLVDFGTTQPGVPVALALRISNTGSANLTGLEIVHDGPQAAEFPVTVAPVAPVQAGNFTTMTVTFTPAALGRRTAALRVSSNDPLSPVFDISLTGTAAVPTGMDFSRWITASGVSPSLAEPLQNPSGDGVSNLLKFAFNLDPSKADVRKLTVGSGQSAGLPGIAATPGPVLKLEYLRRKTSSNPGITYTPQFGSDLTGWTNATGGTVVSVDTTWERVTVTDSPPPGAGIRFGRVRITQP